MAITLESIINMNTRKIFLLLHILPSATLKRRFGLTWMKPLARNAFALISTTTKQQQLLQPLNPWFCRRIFRRCFINAVQGFWQLSNSGSLILFSAAKWASRCCTTIASAQPREEPDLSPPDLWCTALNCALFKGCENFVPVSYGVENKAWEGVVTCWAVERLCDFVAIVALKYPEWFLGFLVE